MFKKKQKTFPFSKAWELLKEGKFIKRKNWNGHWELVDGKIIIHTYDKKEVNLRETHSMIFTFDNIAHDDWMEVE